MGLSENKGCLSLGGPCNKDPTTIGYYIRASGLGLGEVGDPKIVPYIIGSLL